MVHTKESIQTLIDRSDKAVERAIQAIYTRQTEQERRGAAAIERNGIGFSKFDAPVLTAFLQRIERGEKLPYKDMRYARAKVRRYWRQLLEIANGTEELARIRELPREEVMPQRATLPTVSADDAPRYVPHCECENMDGGRVCDWCEERRFTRMIQEAEAREEDARMARKFGAGSW